MIKLDYSIESPEERKLYVENYLNSLEEPPSNACLEILANYLIFSMEKKERAEKRVLTQNRKITIDKRETSFEGLTSKFENGEDGVYNLIKEDKNILFRPKNPLRDCAEIPGLAQIQEALRQWEEIVSRSTGKSAYIAHKAMIETRQEQYVIQSSVLRPIMPQKLTHSRKINKLPFEEKLNAQYDLEATGATFSNPSVVFAILQNYSKLKEAAWGDFEGDLWYFMEDFDALCAKALKPFPLYEQFLILKIDGLSAPKIIDKLGSFTEDYLSVLWRKKIPKLIADKAYEELLIWLYANTPGAIYKKCTQCGAVKPAHPLFYSWNKGKFYCCCKVCRRASYKKGGGRH